MEILHSSETVAEKSACVQRYTPRWNIFRSVLQVKGIQRYELALIVTLLFLWPLSQSADIFRCHKCMKSGDEAVNPGYCCNGQWFYCSSCHKVTSTFVYVIPHSHSHIQIWFVSCRNIQTTQVFAWTISNPHHMCSKHESSPDCRWATTTFRKWTTSRLTDWGKNSRQCIFQWQSLFNSWLQS